MTSKFYDNSWQPSSWPTKQWIQALTVEQWFSQRGLERKAMGSVPCWRGVLSIADCPIHDGRRVESSRMCDGNDITAG